MIPYFSLDSSAQIEAVRQRMLAQNRARQQAIRDQESREQQARLDIIKALTPVLVAALQKERRQRR